MFIRLYSNTVINYDNNTHLIFDTEAKFLTYLESSKVQELTDPNALNYLPNNKTFEIALAEGVTAPSITYIVWFTDREYKHFRVISYDIYSNYVSFKCESDLWADGTYNADFKSSVVRLLRSNMEYTDLESNLIPYSYDPINYTNKKYTQSNLTTNGETNISTFQKTYVVAFDMQVDSWSTATVLFGATWQSVLAVFSSQDLTKLKEVISCNGNSVRIRAVYVIPFLPFTSGTLDLVYKTQGSGNPITVRPIPNNLYYVTKEIAKASYNLGNKKIYVGAGDSMMLLENIAPKANVDYKFILDDYGITAYVCQGDNTKDITDAYTLKVTSNDETLSLQESLMKITGSGFKAVSGALMLGSPATMVGGLATITGAGLDLLPSSKPSSYTLDGNAVTTWLDQYSNGFHMRSYTAINDMEKITELYGVNYNYVASFNAISNSTLITSLSTRRYIKAELIEFNGAVTVEEYNYIKGELERGIYVRTPLVQ